MTGVVLSFSALAAVAAADDAPTTAPYVAYTLIMPPGMKLITVSGHTAICPPQYEEVAQKCLAKVMPATRPTTMASDILEKLANSRAALAREIAADFDIPGDKIAAFLDGTLKPALERGAAIHARVYVLVGTQDQVTALLKRGWHAPLFQYNPLANRTIYEAHVLVDADRPLDDTVLWDEVRPGESDDEIAANMNTELQTYDAGFLFGCAQTALLQVRTKFVTFLSDSVMTPLKMPDSEHWFQLGVTGAMSSKYEAMITGIPRSALAASMSRDSANNPIQSAPIDLLHEFNTSNIKPDYLPYFMDAVSRKGTAVVQKLIDKAGDPAIMEIINSIRAKMPPDNAALVQLIKDDTGVDLTNDLLPPP